MAETEVSKEEVSKEVPKVVGIEEQCVSDMGSHQDLPNGTDHHNQANDLDNSYVFVTGDAVDDKDVGATRGLIVLPESEAVVVEDQGGATDSRSAIGGGGCSEPINEGDNENAERSIGDPPVVADGGDGVQYSVVEHIGKSESLAEAEVKQAEVPDGKVESLAEAGVDRIEDKSVEIEPVTEGEQETLDGLVKSESPHGSVENQESQDGAEKIEDESAKLELVAEGEPEKLDDLMKSEPPPGPVENQESQVAAEKIEDKSVELELLAEGEQEKLDDLIKSESPPGPIENQESQLGASMLGSDSGENREVNNISSHMANGECEDRVNLNAAETLEGCQGSQDTVVLEVECELQEASVEAEDEVKLSREVVETAEHEVPPSSSLDLDLESYSVNIKEGTLEEEAATTLSLNVPDSQRCDAALENKVQGVLEPIVEAESLVRSTDCHVETVLEENDKENVFVSHVDNGILCPEEPERHPDGSGQSYETMQSETKSEASVPSQSFTASTAREPETEVEISDAETIGAVSSSPVDGPESQIIEKGLSGHDGIRRTINEASSESDSTLDAVVPTEKEPASQVGDVHAETEVSSAKAVANSSPATFDVKVEPEVPVHTFSAISSGEKARDVTDVCGTEVSDSGDKESAAEIVLDTEDVEGMGGQLDGSANGDTGNALGSNLPMAPPEGSDESMINGEEASIKTKPKPFNFLIRIPRFDDDSLKEQIRLAKLHVDEKTKLRDAIQVQIQEKRANSQIHGIDYEYARSEARSARKLVKSKRMEIDSLQSVINKAKNALSIEDIDSQMYNMEHMIQHETLPLKEEKQLIREIKQLKQLREQLSSNMGSEDEIKQALEQREEVEERLKILRKELDILKDKVVKAEASAREAGKRYDDQNQKVKELQARFRAADEVRQAAYAQWQSLRKELAKKSKHFFKYKDDAAIATNYAYSRDAEALYRLCTNQVETFMELWNNSEEFRTDYVRFNSRSTIRRFSTLDGRSLGPDEKPLILPSTVDERVNRMVSTPVKADLASQTPIVEPKQETTLENGTSDGKSMKKGTEHKNQKVTNKGPAVPVQVNGLDNVTSSKDVINEVHEEEPKKSREEIEAMRKEEERRREEAEVKLKEQRRLEALAKAQEARERKKRQAEKLQMRAELKTQKEAEQREKEREKRLRKKERKKAAATDVNDTNSCETAQSSESAAESSKDIEVKDSSSVAPKKSQKPWLFAKQSKTKSVPPPLRNRNKKKLQQWMWVGVTSFIILVLFWLGNVGVFSSVNLKRRSPVY